MLRVAAAPLALAGRLDMLATICREIESHKPIPCKQVRQFRELSDIWVQDSP